MNKKKISKVIASALAANMVINPMGGVISTVMADVLDNSVDNIVKLKNSQAIKDSIYLTDLEYIPNLSYSNNGTITNNANKDGSEISLSIDGKVKDFSHGLGVGVDSEVVYDISEYSSKFNTLSVFVGIDDRELSDEKVRFLIYSSEDGENWEPIYQTNFMNRLDNSVYISANVKGVKYLKLFTKGENENPDIKAVYGDIRLLQIEDSYVEVEESTEEVVEEVTNEDTEKVSEEESLKGISTEVSVGESDSNSLGSNLGVDLLASSYDYIADFSFDGENAGCIVMYDKFALQIEVQYSFDGGNVWYDFIGHKYKLTDEELASITVEHGIKVRIKLLQSMNKTINFQVPSAPTSSTVYGNDLEDRLIGNTDYLEYRFSEDDEWKDYTEDVRFTGDKTVEVRYKQHGTSMASASSKYTFRQSTDTEERTYIPLSQVSLYQYCSEENNGYSYAKNMIDGNINTFWHNDWDGEKDLYYTVNFNEVKFISAIEYLPQTGANGRLKSGEVLVSYDGTNWESAGTFKISSNDTNLKKINLDTPMPARYVKIKATETWGSTPNIFFSGRMLNFYEDTTKRGQTEPLIKYSTTKETKNYVTATLVLMEGQTTTESKTYKFLTNGNHEFNYIDAEGQPRTITARVDNIVRDENANSVYLTEIDYEQQSYAGWNGIRYNLSPVGKTIGLMIDGLDTKFSKGIGAHADSELIYDIEAFSKNYTKFSTYVGVDSSRGSNGSVKFIISVSNDGSEWTNVYESDVLSGDSPAEYVSVDIRDYKYLKLTADDIGESSEDHAVYGSPRLVKEGYDVNYEKVEGLLQVYQYDAQIKELHTVGTEMTSEVKRLVMLREFVNRFGYSNLKQYGEENFTNKEAIEYILKNEDVLSLFLEAGTLDFGTGANSVKAWCSIYEKHKSDLMNVMHRKLMIATSVALSRNIQSYMSSWGGGYRYSDPLTRYELMKQLYDENRFVNYNQFNSLSMELIRAVVDARLGDDEILWLRNYTEARYPNSTSNRFNPYNFIAYISPNYGGYDLRDPAKYEQWDAKYKLSENGVLDYGATNMPKIWMSVERGSICWGISGFGSATNEVHGIPSINIYQPQHEAYLVYSEDSNGNGIWSIGNNVFGWESSYTRWAGFASTFSRTLLGWGNKSYISDVKNNASYTLLGQAALNDYENYKEASLYNFLAKVYNDDKNKQIEIYNQALEIQSFNLDSIEGLVNAYNSLGDKSSSEWTELAKKIIKEYTYYPVAMIDLLNLIKSHITEDLDIAEIDLLRTSALNKAANATSAVSLQPDACKAVAKSYLGTQSTYLATFSFDGANAGQIVLNEKYREYTVRVRYSLDGGKTYTESDDQIIQLSDEELAKINSTDDLIVGLVGTEETYTIDILDGVTITNDILYKSDLENRFIGDISGLQFSTDECETWCDYSSDTRFPGSVKVYVRYKPKGVHLASDVASYTFTADNNTDNRTYISIDHLTLAGFPNEQNNTTSAAKNMIDAKDNTGWHTKYSYTTTDKYYTVKLDEIRFISAVEYLPGGVNGRMKDAEVYTSYDGETWTLAATANDLANNANLKKIEFEDSLPARYIKIVAKNTYGNSTGETNMYFSGMAFNYYEDTTKVYDGEPIITYSTTNTTNQYVDAKLVLAEGCEATELTHRFTENGSYEFHYTKNGEEKTITATVNNIVRDLSLSSIYLSDLGYENSSFAGWNGIRKDLAPSGSKINIKVEGSKKQFIKGIGAHADSELFYDISMFSDSYNKFKAYVGVDGASPNGSVSFKILASKNGEDWDELKTTDILSSSSNAVFVDVSIEGYSYLKLIADSGSDTSNDHAVYADAKLVRDKAILKYFNEDGKVTANLLLPEGFEAINGTTHEFTINGTHTFEYKNANGEIHTMEAVVDWMESTTSEKDETIDSGFGIDSNGDDKDVANGEFDGDDGFNVEPPAVDEGNGSETDTPETGDGEDSGDQGNNGDQGSGEDSETPNNPGEGDSTTEGDKDIANGEFDGDDSFLRPDGNATPDKDDNIDNGYLVEDTRNFEVQFSKDSATNEDVTATLVGLSDTDTVTSLCGNTWLFKTNGKHTFVVEDKDGRVFEVPVEVTWIDKEAPIATIGYDYSKAKDGIVIAKITKFSEDGVKITNTKDGVDYYEFSKEQLKENNGSFTFEFIDEAGNTGSVTANVNWFEFDKAETTVAYKNVDEDAPSTPDGEEEEPVENENADYVIASIDVDTEKVEILNNNGSNEVKFIKNGVFAFRARMIETGEEFEILVQVDWLSLDAEEGESPVELPEGDDSSDGDKNPDDSNNGSNGDATEGGNDNNAGNDNTGGSNGDSSEGSEGDNSTEGDNSSDSDKNPDGSENSGSNSDSGENQTPVEDPDVSDKDENIDPDFGVLPPVVDDSTDDSEDEQIPVTPPVANPDNGNNNNGGNTNNGGSNSGSGNGGSGNGGNGDSGSDGEGSDTIVPDNTTSDKDPNIDPDFGIDKEEDPSTSNKDENIDSDFGVDSGDSTSSDDTTGGSTEDGSTGGDDSEVPPVVDETPVTPPIKPGNGNGDGNNNTGSNGSGVSSGTNNKPTNNPSITLPNVKPGIGSTINNIINSVVKPSISEDKYNMDKYIDSFNQFISSNLHGDLVNSSDSTEDSSIVDSTKSDVSNLDKVEDNKIVEDNSTNKEHNKTFIEKVVDIVGGVVSSVAVATVSLFQYVAAWFSGLFRKF